MRLIVSPYHLTTREPAAMAALLLGRDVVTLLPLPPDGIEREQVRAALKEHPRYARMLESWRWSFPLWRAGVIASLDAGEDAIGCVHAAAGRIATDRGLSGLRSFLHEELFGAAGDDCDLFAADLLKGGPDPGISVPVGAGLDAFAAARGLVVVRSGASRAVLNGERVRPGAPARTPSLAQRAESRLAATACSFAVPVLVQAGPATLLAARESLGDPLEDLRRAAEHALSGGGADAAQAARVAAAQYARGFEAWLAARRGHDDDAGVQVLDGYVRVTAQRLPADAVLRSAAVAARAIRPSPPAPDARTTAPVFALVIDPMSARPAGSTPERAADRADVATRA